MHCKNLDRWKSINKKTMLKADFFRTDCYKARENAKIKKILYSQKIYMLLSLNTFFSFFLQIQESVLLVFVAYVPVVINVFKV